MKKLLLILAGFFAIIDVIRAQASFVTGPMEVSVNQYGRIRLFDGDGTRHLQRASILVGTSSTAVFDYTNDSEEYEPTVLVTTPLISDFEIYGAYDNSYSGAPPAVIVKQNAYGWNNESYTIIKFNIKNAGAFGINAMVGVEVIPELNEEYGFDTVTYNAAQDVIRFHRGNHMNMGMKLLSSDLSSLVSFEWYDGYPVDSDFWAWMNNGSIQPQYVSATVDGPVAITSQAALPVAASGTIDVYYALALGATETEMLNNMAAAVAKYNLLFTSVAENEPAADRIVLEGNTPNPFRNVTTIHYELPSAGNVTLKVFDALGMPVATLVNGKENKGKHSVEFDAGKLSAGAYYYTISFENQVRSQKMFLLK